MQARRHFSIGIAGVLLVALAVVATRRGGGRDHDASPSPAVVTPATKVVDGPTAAALTSVLDDGATFVFGSGTPQLASVETSDILVFGVAPLTPHGALRRVTAIDRNRAGGIVADTVPAALDEAIVEGRIDLTRTLTPEDVAEATPLVPGVRLGEALVATPHGETRGFEVTVQDLALYEDGAFKVKIKKASISFTSRIEFSADIGWFSGLKTATLRHVMSEEARVELSADGEHELFKEEQELARYRFSPLTVPVGPVPVVLSPVVRIYIGTEGKLRAALNADVTQTATVTTGFRYDGAWHPIRESDNSFDFADPELTGGGRISGYTGAGLDLLVYDLPGPHADVSAYLRLDADASRQPPWQLQAGLEARVGARMEGLKKGVLDHESPPLTVHETVLAQAHQPTSPALHTIPRALSFGALAPHTSAEQRVMVMNLGGGVLQGSAGGLAPPFSYVGDTRYSLLAGEAKEITVRFRPARRQHYVAHGTLGGQRGASVRCTGEGATAGYPTRRLCWRHAGKEPRHIAATADGKFICFTSSRDDTVGIMPHLGYPDFLPVGRRPSGLALRSKPSGYDGYVANWGDATLTVFHIDASRPTSTCWIGRHIRLGSWPQVHGPRSVTVSPDGKYVYVATDSGSLAVIDADREKLHATIKVSGSAPDVKASRDGRYLYVADAVNRAVVVLSAKDFHVLQSIPLGASPFHLELSPLGHCLCVAHPDAGTISLVRTSDRVLIRTLEVDRPWKMAFTPDGRYLFVVTRSRILYRIETASERIVEARKVPGASDIVFTADGGCSYMPIDRGPWEDGEIWIFGR